MQETIKVLLGLQELDTKIHSVKDELKRLPQERERRRKTIDARIATLDQIDEEVRRLNLQIREIDLDTTQSRQKVRKYENELNNTADATVIAALQHQIRSLKRDISQAEEEGLEAAGRVEELEAKRAEMAAGIAEEEGFFVEFEENMKAELVAAEEKLVGLQQDRAQRIQGEQLDSNVVEVYERLLDAREGQSLAMLEGKTCQSCHMEVPANLFVRIARGADLVLCPSCGRILYLPQ